MSAEITYELSFLDAAVRADAHQRTMARLGERETWEVNNSGIVDYSERARLCGEPYAHTLQAIIESAIGHSEDNVGLDIAAGTDAQALRDLLDEGILGIALATNFFDSRSELVMNDPRLKHIAGDLTKLGTWMRIAQGCEDFAPNGFAIAMHRPVGALQNLPPITYTGAANFILDRIKPGGLMFTQVPRSIVEEAPALNGLCRAVRGRGDIADIILSDPAEFNAHQDWADTYAVLLKK